MAVEFSKVRVIGKYSLFYKETNKIESPGGRFLFDSAEEAFEWAADVFHAITEDLKEIMDAVPVVAEIEIRKGKS